MRAHGPDYPRSGSTSGSFFAPSFHSGAVLVDARACVVAASHLRFVPSRSIPWPGVRTRIVRGAWRHSKRLSAYRGLAAAFLWRSVRGRLRPGRFPRTPVSDPRTVRHPFRVRTAGWTAP